MKKILTIVLCVVLAVALVGCGTPTEMPSESVDTTPEPTVEATPEPTPAMLDKEVKKGMISYAVPSGWREGSSDSYTTMFYYPYADNADGYIGVDVNTIPTPVTEQNMSEMLDGVLKGISDSVYVTDFVSEKVDLNGVEAVRCSYKRNENYERGAYDVEAYIFINNNKLYNFFAFVPPMPLDEPSTTFQSVVDSITVITPKDDFLKDGETQSQIFKMANSYDFTGIIELANAYIETNAPAETDTAYQLIELANQANAILESCSVVSDDFEETVTVYGSGADSITSDTNIVPYLEGYDLKVKLGFYASDWIFFDEVKVKVGGDEYVSFYFDHFNVAREVGDGISEIATTSIKEDELEQIANAEFPVMRFIGEDEKTRDHELSESEITACNTILNLSVVRGNIADVVNAYKEENGM